MTRPPRLPYDAGIAIGPILFVIAILAVLAAAIAAGSGSFTGGTSKEQAKLMAQAILAQADNLDNCVQVVRGNGYDDTQISFQVPAGMFLDSTGADWGQTTSPANCTSDACRVYKPAGGGCTPVAIPEDAVDQENLNSNHWFTGICPLGNNVGCRAPYVNVLQLQIESGAPLHLAYAPTTPFTTDVCMEINNLVGITNPSGDAPHGVYSSQHGCGAYDCSAYGGGSIVFNSSQTFTANKDFCYFDDYLGIYSFIHVFR